MGKKNSITLLIVTTITLIFFCKSSVNSQTLTDVLKYGKKINLNSEIELMNNSLSYTTDFEAFVGLIERDTVVGFRITDLINKNYNWMEVTSSFSLSKIRIDFQDGTYSTLKPIQVDKAVINEGKSTYYESLYFFKVYDLSRFDRPLKLITLIDEKTNVSREIFGASNPNDLFVDLDYFVMAYLIPYEIGNLDVLPTIGCSFTLSNTDIEMAFPKIFPKTRSAFCHTKSVTNCKCVE